MYRKIPSLPDIKLPLPVPKLATSSSTSLLTGISSGQSSPIGSPQKHSWRLTFTQPAAQYLAFRQRLETNCISLENISVSSTEGSTSTLSLYGTIKVNNIAFEKSVKLRVTRDNWINYKDYPATHSAEMSSLSGANNSYDVFMFNVFLQIGETENQIKELQFAVCFRAGPEGANHEYWDNNDGCNYVIVRQLTQNVSPRTEEGINSPMFFRHRPSQGLGNPVCQISRAAGNQATSISSSKSTNHPYTTDFRPNFEGFQSLTSYSSWQHYSHESMYY